MGNGGIALRRAIAQAYDLHRLVDVVYSGQAIVANQLVPPRAAGHDPAMPAKAQHDPATANALLDRAGYDKRDREGFRMAPGGKPLKLSMMFASGGVSREIQTLWKRNMDAVGLRFEFREAPFQDYIKELEAGKFQIYNGGYGGTMTGYAELIQLYSPEPPTVNTTRFKLRAYDEAMEQYLRSATPDAQVAAARTMSEMARTYMPILPAIFRLENDFVQPWVLGFSPPVFQSYWKYLDIDLAKRRQSANGQ
jgi:ABC-type oligopeptide transport system substrate-binding subunit